MKYFIIRIILFLIPLMIYVLLSLYVDPYNILRKENNPKLIELKSEISYKLNYPLYKLGKYSYSHADIIFLGDSRTDNLNIKIGDSITSRHAVNLAYGAGTLSEAIETFWYAIKAQDIKEIYFGINFDSYSKNNNMNRVHEAISLMNSPFSYLFSQYCFKSTFYIIKTLLINEKIYIGKPNLNKDEFWRYQLEYSANNLFRDYKYPKEYFIELSKISNYCNKNNIKLIFFIPPTHIDLQQKVNEFKLVPEEIRFKTDLSKLSLVYDFDYPNKLTENRDNFKDPFHTNDSISKIVIKEIVTGKILYALKSNNAYKK